VVEPEELLAGHSIALAVFERVRSVLQALGPLDIRTSKSQVAFRRSRGFAYLWLPGQHLARPAADVVLSFALGRHESSPRIKEVVHPSPRHWMHHLEIRDPREIDDQVVAWLKEAAERAG
jgi:Domain of unknown function (DUF5655)